MFKNYGVTHKISTIPNFYFHNIPNFILDSAAKTATIDITILPLYTETPNSECTVGTQPLVSCQELPN